MSDVSAAYLIRLGICVFPVLAFLAGLLALDSFKLTPMRRLAGCVAAGGLVAAIAYGASSLWLGGGRPGAPGTVVQAPVVEELLKAVVIWVLLLTSRIGFLVEGAIYGFAVGAGFATVENVIYLHYLSNAGLLVWMLRGLGTAIMHGGGTAIVGIAAASQAHRKGVARFGGLIAGWAIASAVHILYNSPLLSPGAAAALMILMIPALLASIFMRSEKAVEHWLGEGFDQDLELLNQIASGAFNDSAAGVYLGSLKESFPAPIVADMLCIVQLSTELSIRAKAEMLKREAGFEAALDPEVKDRLIELKHLEKNIGATGRLAIAPLLARHSRRLWELRQLGYGSV